MKKTIRLIIAIIAIGIGASALSSCESYSSGFREGWNSTAPSEYRY